MKDLSLKQMNDFGIGNFMSDKEVEKAIAKALEQQQTALTIEKVLKEQSSVVQQTLEDVLRDGGLFTYTLNKKKYKINVLTKDDMNILDNSSNYLEDGVGDGVEYDIVKPYRYHCRNGFDNYVSVKASSYDDAQEVIDSIYGKGIYIASASVL